MTARILPLAGQDVYLAVMERADWRCQCERDHPGHKGGRCDVHHAAGVRLLAGPLNPGPDPARDLRRWRGAPEGLVAWCPRCWDREVQAARREVRRQPNPTPALF